MKDIVVFVAIWGRPKVVEIFAKGIERLQEELYGEYAFHVVAAVSNKADQDTCRDLGFETIGASNEALGLKMNYLCQEALNIPADYYLQMGSDNLISKEWIRMACKQIDNGADMVAGRSLYFIDPYSWRACNYTYWTPTLNHMGAGRMFRPEALEAMKDADGFMDLWPDDASKGLDGKSEARMIDKDLTVETIKLKKGKAHVIDIKTETNIWPFDRFYSQTNRCDVSGAMWFCGSEEIEYLYNYGSNR